MFVLTSLGALTQAMLEADKGLVKLCLGLVSCLWDLLSEKNIAKPERV